MSIESGVSFLLIIFIFAVTPGPGVFALLARSLASGARPCLSLAFGMVISDVIYLLLACLGLAMVARQWAGLFLVIRIVGSLYLLYLGWKLWRAAIDPNLHDTASKGSFSTTQGLVQGFLISASNPKVIFFYIAFLPTLLDLDSLTPTDVVLAVLLTVTGLMAGLMLIAFCASSARHLFRSKKAVRRLNRTSGAIMIGAGAWLGLHG